MAIFKNFSEEEVQRLGIWKSEALLPFLQLSQKLKPELLQLAESHTQEELKLALFPYREKLHFPDLHYKLLLTGSLEQLKHIDSMIEDLKKTEEYGKTKAEIVENVLIERLQEIIK